MRAVLSLLFFVAFASAQCANWTHIYTFDEWDVNTIVSFNQHLTTTFSIERGWDGMSTQLRLTTYGNTVDEAKAWGLGITADGVVDPNIAFSITVVPPEIDDAMESDGVVNSWFLGDYVRVAASLAMMSGTALAGSVARASCTPTAEVRLILSPANYDDLYKAISEGFIVVDVVSTSFSNTTAILDVDSCLDQNVQALYFTSCDKILLAAGLGLSSSADLLLVNIFTTAVNDDPELFEDKYDPVENPWQECAIKYLNSQIGSDASLNKFSCAVRGLAADGNYCGSKVNLLTFTYNPTDTVAYNAVANFQTDLESIQDDRDVWPTFAKYYTNEEVCPYFNVRADGVCETQPNEGCNPEELSCCVQKSCTFKDETTGYCPSGSFDWSDPYNLTASPDALRKRATTLTGPSCSGNHPLVGKPGVCIHKSTCASKGGKSVRGLCPAYGADILCCAGKGFAYKYQSSSKLCADYTGDEVYSIKGNGGVTYSVVKIHKIHLTDPSSYSASATSRDNTMEVSTACAFSKMRNAALKSGISIKISSGFRTLARQQYFYNCYKCKCCNGGNLAAVPGTSNHGRGLALDLNTNCGKQSGSTAPSACTRGGVYRWLRNNGKTYGFVRTVRSEPWHWEYRPGTKSPSYQ